MRGNRRYIMTLDTESYKVAHTTICYGTTTRVISVGSVDYRALSLQFARRSHMCYSHSILD